MDKLRYPIGQYSPSSSISEDQLNLYILSMGSLPSRVAEAVNNLTDEQLDTPYRPGGWTVRQLVHHVADSHMNAYIRFKLALTEEHWVLLAEPMARKLQQPEPIWLELKDGPLQVMP